MLFSEIKHLERPTNIYNIKYHEMSDKIRLQFLALMMLLATHADWNVRFAPRITFNIGKVVLPGVKFARGVIFANGQAFNLGFDLGMSTSNFAPERLRHMLGKTVIALSSECSTLVAEEDGKQWLCFTELQVEANFALFQDNDREYLKIWLQKVTATQFEHYIFLSGDAIQHTDLLKEDYLFDIALPFMSFDLPSNLDKLVEDPRVRKGTVEDRVKLTELLAKSFHTTFQCQWTFAGASGHSSPYIDAFMIEENGEILSNTTIAIVDGIVGVWSVASSEKARRRGLARATLNTALKHAYSLGGKIAVLLSSEDGKKLYTSMGWNEVEIWQLWVTRDSFPRVADLSLYLNKPYLRHVHGLTGSELVLGWPGVHSEHSQSLNWINLVSEAHGNFSLVQNKSIEDCQQWISHIKGLGKSTCLYFAGPARKHFKTLRKGFILFPSVPIMVCDLSNPSIGNVFDPRVRKATLDDRDQVQEIISNAFTKPEGDLNAYANGAGHPDSNIYTWVIETNKHLQGTVTVVIKDDVAHLWAMGVNSLQRRHGLATALLTSALHHARTKGATMGFLASSDDGLELYKKNGWVILEEWDLCFYHHR
jgi:GNAT superfamily N-acetyltransferase